MRVAIMGSGGLGGMFGGLQARAGHDVTFIARGLNLRALQEGGITVRFPDAEFHLNAKATEDPSDIGPVDVVWFCVKTYDVPAAARQIVPLVGPETMVLTLQNGVGTAEQIDSLIGEGHVIGAVTAGGATLTQPGLVVTKQPNTQVTLGEIRGGASRRTERLREELREAGIGVQVDPQIQIAIWDKFVAACLTLGLCALMRLPLAPILACEESAAFARGILEEAEAVTRANGIDLQPAATDRWLHFLHEYVARNPAATGSMFYDLIEGRRLELEAVNGAAVRLGRELGIPTPMNFAVYAALMPYLNGAPLAESRD